MSDEVLYKYVKGKGWIVDHGPVVDPVARTLTWFEIMTGMRFHRGPTVVIYPRSISYTDGI